MAFPLSSNISSLSVSFRACGIPLASLIFTCPLSWSNVGIKSLTYSVPSLYDSFTSKRSADTLFFFQIA